MGPWERLNGEIVSCARCPRLRAHCEEIARVKRRAFRDQTYWGRPVPGFGDTRARVLFCGLAPAAHGANRTGRMFTGDDSGNWLYDALHRAGFATQPTSSGEGDGLALRDAFITASARCAPPDNNPSPTELAACAPFLDRELALLDRVRVVVALGQIAWNTTLQCAQRVDPASLPSPRPKFGHGAEARVRIVAGGAPVTLLGSYHPSRQNTNTGRLTRAMLDGVLLRAREL
jgi:uracil-DNA glycosylase family 4